MSLLMEALKKAEQAKRVVTEGPVAVPTAPAPVRTLALELTPAEPVAVKAVPISAPPPAPALTAAAFTLMTGRVTESPPPVTSSPANLPAEPPPVEASPLPPSPPPTPVAPPPIARAPVTPVLSLDTSGQAARPVPVARPLPQRPRFSRMWIAGGIGLLFASAGGGYWYYNSMAQYLTQQSAMGVPPAVLAPAATEPPAAAPVAPPVVVTPPPVRSAAVKNAPRPAAKVNSSIPATPVAAAVPAPVAAVPSGVPPAAEAVESVPVPPSVPITISRDVEQNEIFAALQTAYRAYQSGDDSSAQKLYAGILVRDQHNRDALLGLAALAVRQRDFVRAQEIYSELLTLDPKDSVAQAGFVSVTGSFDPLQQEARIKTLLEQEPGAPHLLFTYASFLMQQQRWIEAARSLQSALQAQRDNADYAFNLAVSFDHLGQVDAAVKYYRLALDLAAKQSTRFQPGDVQRRLKAMSASSRSESSP